VVVSTHAAPLNSPPSHPPTHPAAPAPRKPALKSVTYADYLATEALEKEKHEYVRGEVFAMSGGTPTHARIAMSVGAALVAALRGKPCSVFSSDLRVRVPSADLSTYPDVTVVCERVQHAADDAHAVVNPTVLVEVLSPSTEAWDRGDKFAHYRQLPALREYLLVTQDAPRFELFSRGDADRWELREAGPGEAIELWSLGVALSVDDVYRDPLRDPLRE
jgi:Uma2 family endonuclease